LQRIETKAGHFPTIPQRALFLLGGICDCWCEIVAKLRKAFARQYINIVDMCKKPIYRDTPYFFRDAQTPDILFVDLAPFGKSPQQVFANLLQKLVAGLTFCCNYVRIVSETTFAPLPLQNIPFDFST